MVTGLVDHLWQSCCCCGLAWLFSRMTRGNAAVVRLWLWRVAVLKFLVPFSLLFAFGGWLGFPSAHSADPTPDLLVAFFRATAPIDEPAQHFSFTGFGAAAVAVLALVGACICAWWAARHLHREQSCATSALEAPPSLGFWRAALLTASALVMLSAPLLAGAVADHEWRRELLIANSELLVDVPVVLTTAVPGLGQRYRVIADEHGVLVRNASIRDLIAIVYGVNSYSVWVDQMYQPDEDGRVDSWLLSPRYDVRAEAPIREPGKFDAYALRRPVSRILADRFGLAIYVNGDCQPPCGIYKLPMAAEPL
jgi:hypothetical protein